MGVLLLWILRALALLLILRLLLRMLFGPGGVFGARQPPRTTGRPRGERIGGELVRDPQCGTYIPRAGAIVAGTGSDAQYFCSAKCRDEYERH